MVAYRILVLVLVLLYAGPVAAQVDVVDVSTILAPATLSVERLEPYSPPRFLLLSSKLKNAAQRNPTWWRAQAANAKPGEPLPYDERLGLTREEYTEYLQLVDSLVMKPVGTTDTIIVMPTASGWRFEQATTLAALRGIEIDTVRGIATTPYGELRAAKPIMPSAGQRATGPWRASRWQRQEVDGGGTVGTVATFAIGRLLESGQPIIYYAAKDSWQEQFSDELIWFYVVLHSPRITIHWSQVGSRPPYPGRGSALAVPRLSSGSNADSSVPWRRTRSRPRGKR